MLTFNMSSNKVQCDMCCKEQAVGYCNTCGNIGETCVGIHNTGKIFQTHILNIYVNDENNRMHIMFDITGEKCKHHLTENTSLYCRVHGVMICGQCFRLDHCSCGHEVVDLYQEAGRFDKDQYNAMFATLNEIQSEAQRVKEEVDSKKERSNNRAVECNKELDDFENKLKRKVEDSISSFRQEVSNLNDEIIEACSCISSICEEKVAWAIKEKSQLNEIVKNSFSGRFYLMNQNFEKEISEVKRQIKEVEYKRTVRLFHLTENTTAFKCFIEDLKDVCQLQEEVVGSDEGNTYTMGKATQENQETRKDLMEALIISKLDVDTAEATRKDLMEALIISKAARLKAEEELKRTEEDLAYFKRECGMVQKQYRHAQKCIYWKQPTGSLKVEVSQEQRLPIGISFTFMDGLQTRYQPFPGQPYKGSTFEGRLKNDSEGVTVCGMLKTAFKRGQMFTIGKDGSVGLDGISMFDSPLLAKVSRSRYVKYIEKVKAEMKAKGITEANIDETEKLEETFSVAGP